MATDDHRRRPLQGKVDFTLMYAVHDAFHRDLRCLTAAVKAGQTADPAVRTGSATFKNQLHIHHTAEDTSLWPPLRQKVTRLEDTAVLDAMEAEHARIDPLLSQVDASLAASDRAGLAGNTQALTAALALRQNSTRSIIQAMQKTGARSGGLFRDRRSETLVLHRVVDSGDDWMSGMALDDWSAIRLSVFTWQTSNSEIARLRDAGGHGLTYQVPGRTG